MLDTATLSGEIATGLLLSTHGGITRITVLCASRKGGNITETEQQGECISEPRFLHATLCHGVDYSRA